MWAFQKGVGKLAVLLLPVLPFSCYGLQSLTPSELEAFEDADCLTDHDSLSLLALVQEMCDLLDSVIEATLHEDDSALSDTVNALNHWGDVRSQLLLRLLNTVFFNRMYCEPGKIASIAATCILFLFRSGAERAVACVEDVDALLSAMTPRGQGFQTRFHTLLRSPWPVFRLLDALVRLYPESDSNKLGFCRSYENWNRDPDIFDWPAFKSLATSAVDALVTDEHAHSLHAEDGPLSEQYRSRWLRIYERNYALRQAASLATQIFHDYRTNHYQAGCYPGVISAYALQLLVHALRDGEAWLQRYVAAVAKLMEMHTPLIDLMKTDWPLFRVLHLFSLIRRATAQEVPLSNSIESSIDVQRQPAEVLTQRVHTALLGADSSPPPVAYVTAVWGTFANFLDRFLSRWEALALPRVLVLAPDPEASRRCQEARRSENAVCVEGPPGYGVEATVAKYLALAAVAHAGSLVVWLDLDVYLPADPTSLLSAALAPSADTPARDVVFAGSILSQSINPSVVAARGDSVASVLFLRYASWLYESPYILDHQGWDSFLDNREGDFGSGWDYQGRNISGPEDGLAISFLPQDESLIFKGDVRWALLGPEFACGDGVMVEFDQLASFHFWGVPAESMGELFNTFYPYTEQGFSNDAHEILKRRRRVPKDPRAAATPVHGGQLHIAAFSYADGCCAQALVRNRESALSVGVDQADAYTREDLDPDWVLNHSNVLSERKGAGWWLWKPYLVLRALRDERVPWHRGVVLWLDAGNLFIADPRPFLERVLARSDVAALSLKCCIESDWTSRTALRLLGADRDYRILDRPQLGAYFLVFRKTNVTLKLVEDWLRHSEDASILSGEASGGDSVPNENDVPGYQRHMYDQSVLSVLFKQYGFRALSLEEGHQVVRLERWRE